MKAYSKTILLVALALSCLPLDADAFSWPWKKKKAESSTVETPKKTPYEKFLSKKDLKKEEGFVNIYSYGQDIYLEIPDSLMGEQIAVSAMLTECSDPRVSIGDDISRKRCFIFDRSDSLVLIKRSYLKNRGGEIRYALPIKYRNADSTAFIVKASALFEPSDKEIVSFKGSYEDYSIFDCKFSSSDKSIISIKAATDYVAAEKSFSGRLSLSSMTGGVSSDSPKISGKICIRYSLLPKKEFKGKEYDSRMGVLSQKIREYDPDKASEAKAYAPRWDFSEAGSLCFYVDTALIEPYRRAVEAAVGEWSRALETIGLKDKLSCKALSAEVDILDPKLSLVLADKSKAENISSWIYVPDGKEIISARINIPSGLEMGIYRNVSSWIGDSDPRFLDFPIPDDALYEYVYSQMLYQIGKSLGLSINFAAAQAFPSAKLSSAEFTSRYGISPSVMMAARCNIYPSREDVQNGALLFQDRVGEWDLYTLKWLYDCPDFEFDEKVLFLGSKSFQLDYRGINDTRFSRNAIGDDPLLYADAVFEHSKSILQLAPALLEKAEHQTVTDLFVDFIYLNMFNSVSCPMSYVGGMKLADMRQGSSEKKCEALPLKVQQKNLEKALAQIDRMQELNEYCRPLIQMAGLNKDFGNMNMMNSFNLVNVRGVLPRVELAYREGGSALTPEAYMDKVVDYICKNASKGELSTMEAHSLNSAVAFFASMNHVCYSAFLKALNPSDQSAFALDDIAAASSGVPAICQENYPLLGVRALERMDKAIDRGIARSKDSRIKYQLEYISCLVKSSLVPFKQ